VNEYVSSLEGRLCDGRFSSVTCAEDNWKELQSIQLRIQLLGSIIQIQRTVIPS